MIFFRVPLSGAVGYGLGHFARHGGDTWALSLALLAMFLYLITVAESVERLR